MCGIIGLLSANQNPNLVVSTDLYEGLGLLQHRGQDAAGIVTCAEKGRLFQCKGNGMVRDVFSQQQIFSLKGYMGVGHVRYPTAGTSSNSEAQPFYVNSPYGLVLAHNGNLTNAEELVDFLDKTAHRHVNTDSDSELLLNILANNLQKTDKVRINEQDIFTACEGVYQQCKGGYACIGMIAGYGLLAFRDPNGIRPLIYASRKTEFGTDYMIASESVALDALGFSNFIDVLPGEVVIFKKDSTIVKKQLVETAKLQPCIFEYVYFARPDSIIDGVSVYKSRLAMGEALAEQVLKVLGKNIDVDVVIPVPDTSRVAALQVANKLNISYREGFIKNRYIGRTFIMPGQQQRKKNVRRKLNPMLMEFSGKNVLIVDDSIVRGTTSREIVAMARECGARKVYFASCAPPIRFPNVYGIDMPTRQELVAFNKNLDEIAKEIGADCVIYQELDDLVKSVNKFNQSIQTFDLSVFSGSYVTGDIDEDYILRLEEARNEKTRKPLIENEVLGLYNSFERRSL